MTSFLTVRMETRKPLENSIYFGLVPSKADSRMNEPHPKSVNVLPVSMFG